jgi:hypothetical protein
MPKSERQQLLRDLQLLSTFAFVINNRSILEKSLLLRRAIESSRFLSSRVHQARIPHYFLEVFPELSDTEFRNMFRTTRQGFSALCNTIHEHPIFSNNARVKQAHPAYQLATVMARFGCNGNGASVSKIQSHFALGAGTVSKYTERVIKALLDIEEKWIKWPSPERRREIGRVLGTEGFPKCVGFIDGTTIPLSQKPGLDGVVYFDRKKQ